MLGQVSSRDSISSRAESRPSSKWERSLRACTYLAASKPNHCAFAATASEWHSVAHSLSLSLSLAVTTHTPAAAAAASAVSANREASCEARVEMTGFPKQPFQQQLMESGSIMAIALFSGESSCMLAPPDTVQLALPRSSFPASLHMPHVASRSSRHRSLRIANASSRARLHVPRGAPENLPSPLLIRDHVQPRKWLTGLTRATVQIACFLARMW